MKSKRQIVFLFLLLAYMFGSIFATAALTGWREMRDFTTTDAYIFAVFAVLELAALVLLFRTAVIIGRANRAAGQIEATERTPYQKALARQNVRIYIVSLLSAFALELIGVVLLGSVMNESKMAAVALLFIGLIALLAVANVVVSKILYKHIVNKGRAQVMDFIYAHRNHANESALRLAKRLRALLCVTRVYTVIIALLGCTVALFSAKLSIVAFLAAFPIYGALSRIPMKTPKELFVEDNGFIPREDWPEAYALADETAEAVGVKGDIILRLTADMDAGIRRYGDVISVSVGALLCNVMTREELRSIFLHEFAHLGSEAEGTLILQNHHTVLDDKMENPVFPYPLTSRIFTLIDVLYNLNFMLYTYASTISDEEKADGAMIKYGKSHYAGSSLLKLKYYELYKWEVGSYDTEPDCLSEKAEEHIVEREIAKFKERLSKRRSRWNELIDVEIISRAATHPTIKMRLCALGHTDYSVHESTDSDSYIAEQKRMMEYVDAHIYEARTEVYEDERREFYLDPLATVDGWKEAGEPITPDGYRDVIYNLRCLGRINEANALCDRVIEQLPDSANHYACFIKGCTLLHSFDEAGIEYIYRAIESNHNYIDEGMQTIGQFCCISGRQDELDTYRERVLKMAAEQDEKYSELDHITPKDNLTSEHLPEDIHNGLMAVIGAHSEVLSEVHLVRKIITADFFASVVAVKFKDGTENGTRGEVLDKFFAYLDTQDWQFTLFDTDDIPINAITKVPSARIYSDENRPAF